MLMMLAQAQETAEKAVGLLERINAGGVSLLSLVVATIAVVGYIFQLRRNNEIEQSWREAGKADAEKRLSEIKELMREMLIRDKEGTQAHGAAIQAVEGLSGTIKEHGADERRMMGEIAQKVAELERSMRIGGFVK